MILPASDEIDDLDLIALAHHARGIQVALEDDEIQFDGDAARVDVEAGEQFGNRERAGQVMRLTIERDGHSIERTQPSRSLPGRHLNGCLTAQSGDGTVSRYLHAEIGDVPQI